jgi:hypothetical protein
MYYPNFFEGCPKSPILFCPPITKEAQGRISGLIYLSPPPANTFWVVLFHWILVARDDAFIGVWLALSLVTLENITAKH